MTLQWSRQHPALYGLMATSSSPEPWPSSAPIFGSASVFGTFSWRGRLGRERTMAKKFSSFNSTHHKMCAKTSCMAAHEDQLMIKTLFALSHCSFLIGSVWSVAEGPGFDIIFTSQRVLCLILNWPNGSAYTPTVYSQIAFHHFFKPFIFHNFLLKQIFHHNHPL